MGNSKIQGSQMGNSKMKYSNMEGKGIYYCNDGDRYEGDWRNDKMEKFN